MSKLDDVISKLINGPAYVDEILLKKSLVAVSETSSKNYSAEAVEIGLNLNIYTVNNSDETYESSYTEINPILFISSGYNSEYDDITKILTITKDKTIDHSVILIIPSLQRALTQISQNRWIIFNYIATGKLTGTHTMTAIHITANSNKVYNTTYNVYFPLGVIRIEPYREGYKRYYSISVALNGAEDYSIPLATKETAGAIIVGDGFSIENDGTLSLDPESIVNINIDDSYLGMIYNPTFDYDISFGQCDFIKEYDKKDKPQYKDIYPIIKKYYSNCIIDEDKFKLPRIMLYPEHYTQHQEDNGSFSSNKSPAKLFGGIWVEIFNREGVFFRTAGGYSEDKTIPIGGGSGITRRNGVQDFAAKSITGILGGEDSNTGAAFLREDYTSGSFRTYGSPARRWLSDNEYDETLSGDRFQRIMFDSGLVSKVGREIRPTNRTVKVWIPLNNDYKLMKLIRTTKGREIGIFEPSPTIIYMINMMIMFDGDIHRCIKNFTKWKGTLDESNWISITKNSGSGGGTQRVELSFIGHTHSSKEPTPNTNGYAIISQHEVILYINWYEPTYNVNNSDVLRIGYLSNSAIKLGQLPDDIFNGEELLTSATVYNIQLDNAMVGSSNFEVIVTGLGIGEDKTITLRQPKLISASTIPMRTSMHMRLALPRNLENSNFTK